MAKNQKSYFLYLENVHKAYGNKLVLDDIDLAVNKGEFCTLVGPSGCGKSTLFRLILGQERPTSGSVMVEGKPVGYPNPERGIVYQKYPLYPHLSVLDNVLMGPRFSAGIFESYSRRKEMRDEAMEYLKRVGLENHKDKYPHELSGGMQQRVAIVQALIMKPKILMMDEPFGALDPSTRENLQIFTLEIWEEFKMTVFFVTHDLEEAVFLGTRVLALSQYYSDGRGKDFGRGSKIMFDVALAKRANATAVKDLPEFRGLIQQIREEAFEPAHLQHVTRFNLKHPPSFQTLTDEERKDL